MTKYTKDFLRCKRAATVLVATKGFGKMHLCAQHKDSNDRIYKGFLHPCPQCNFYDFVRGGCEELSCYILDALKEKENG